MAFRFSDAQPFRFQPGMLYLGRDDLNHDIGIRTEKHALTIGGPRSGKGAALIVQNGRRWPHNLLCIDPSGENVEACWQEREALGQAVYVLDPFRMARVPDRLRASCNLLDEVRVDSLTAREDIRAIADGLVMRHDPKHGDWQDAQVDILAGLIAFVKLLGREGMQTLLDVRTLLNLPDEPAGEGGQSLAGIFGQMMQMAGCGGLARTGANLGLSSLATKGEGPTAAAVSGARTNTKWLDSEAIASSLETSTFRLSELKTGRVSVFLVLPSEYLDEHGRFLRLFVRCALDAMTKGGKVGEENPTGGINQPCLFILDEFFSLGYIPHVEKAAGLLPKNGIHLWPFLQDIGQLIKLYGGDGAHTFFGGADAHVFFGNTDAPTLEYISTQLGRKTTEDIDVKPPTLLGSVLNDQRAWASAPLPPPRPTPHIPHKKLGALLSVGAIGVDAIRGGFHNLALKEQAETRARIEAVDRLLAAADANAMREYQHAMNARGEARLTPDEVKSLVAKPGPKEVARSMIVFTGYGPVLNLSLAPYYKPAPAIIVPPEEQERLEARLKYRTAMFSAAADCNAVNDEINAHEKESYSQGLNKNIVGATIGIAFAVCCLIYNGSISWLWLLAVPPAGLVLGFICQVLEMLWIMFRLAQVRKAALKRFCDNYAELWKLGEPLSESDYVQLGDFKSDALSIDRVFRQRVPLALTG